MLLAKSVHGRLNARRLAYVADRFQSPFDGERLAALEAAGRMLAAAGLSWRDLIDRAAEAQNDDDAGEPVGAHHQDAAELLRHAGDELTTWERSFLRGCIGFPKLSDKQQRTLAEIARKVAAMHGADA